MDRISSFHVLGLIKHRKKQRTWPNNPLDFKCAPSLKVNLGFKDLQITTSLTISLLRNFLVSTRMINQYDCYLQPLFI